MFDEDSRLSRLSKMGDPLEKVASAVDGEIFRPILNAIFVKEPRGAGGRPPIETYPQDVSKRPRFDSERAVKTSVLANSGLLRGFLLL